MSVISTLLSRNSVKMVQGPGPSQEQLEQILQTAMVAPDHGKLRPWRFKLIRGEAVEQLGDLSVQAMAEEGMAVAPTKEASIRAWLKDVPLLIAVACHLDHSNDRIPEHERLLATGAAVMNMLNAAHALGLGAYWSTGLGTYTHKVPEALGFDSLDYSFMGFIVVGSLPDNVPVKERPNFSDYVGEWKGV
ncbi:nitroreductase [Paenalcaligenes sp. Me131]|uniref:nitroreductase family protein n=1 Tax=Paenalcaligenes sp. Me131 TaxID=3392636 RepID=UPI003D2C5F3C